MNAQRIGETTPAPRARGRSLRSEESLWGWLLILPSLIGTVVFGVIPIVGSFGVSFTNWTGISQPKFNGLTNYARAIGDERALQYSLQTLIFTAVAVPLGLIVSLGLAAMIHNVKSNLGKGFFRTLYYLPMVTAGVATAVLFKSLFTWMGVNWLTRPDTVLPTVAFFSVWQGAGASMILFMAALSNVSKELYEAAQLDGAKSWQMFRYITMPMVSPTIFLVLVLGLIAGLQVFETILFMTRGGEPGDSSVTIALYIYRTAFKYFRMGYATALSWLLALVLIVLLVVQWRMQKRWVHYD
jgi:multiple sugar transport system permease protein